MRSAPTTIIRTTRAGRAPSARRTPISRVRVETVYDIKPYRPTAASASASMPNIDVSSIISRSLNRLFSTCEANVRMRTGLAGVRG